MILELCAQQRYVNITLQKKFIINVFVGKKYYLQYESF